MRVTAETSYFNSLRAFREGRDDNYRVKAARNGQTTDLGGGADTRGAYAPETSF